MKAQSSLIDDRHMLVLNKYFKLKASFENLFNSTLFFRNKIEKPLTNRKILNSFAVVSMIFQIIFWLIFKSYSISAQQPLNINWLLVPLILNASVLFFSVKGMTKKIFIVATWVIPSTMLALSIYNPLYNYSGIIIIYMLMILYGNDNKYFRTAGFIYLSLINYIINFRYNSISGASKFHTAFELDILIAPLLCLFIYIVHIRIKNAFIAYRMNIEQQRKKLIETNESLNKMILIDEEKNDKLKQLLLSKERLISIISHDVRTPINAVSFFISSYEKGYITPEIFINNLIEVKKDIINLNQMVIDMAKYANAFNKKNEEVSRVICKNEIEKVFQSVLSVYTLSAKNKNLAVSTNLNTTNDISLSISKNDIEILLRNLVSNAIKFSNPNGKINIELHEAQAEKNDCTSYAWLSVQDFGVGIPDEVLKKITANQYLSTLGTQDEVGLGIGLRIIFDIIGNNELDFNIKSSKNEGTTFSIKIPITKNDR